MALIKCNECKKEISSTARQCPSCGYKIKKVGLFWPIIFGLILFVYFFGDEEKISKKTEVKKIISFNQEGRDSLQKQYWDPGYVESSFSHTKKFIIKIKSPPRGEAAKTYAKVVCQQAKEDYNAKGFDIFIMNFNREVFGHSACY
tara:strand:- start:144 stop:578 length:435 start_codon:yes stop_codon:yes gene_type:complete